MKSVESDILFSKAIIKDISKEKGISEEAVSLIMEQNIKFIQKELMLDKKTLSINIPYMGIMYFCYSDFRDFKRMLSFMKELSAPVRMKLDALLGKYERLKEFEIEATEKGYKRGYNQILHFRKPIIYSENFKGVGKTQKEIEDIQNKEYEEAIKV